ncbi:MAG: GAF domain-containing protein, partial [Pseudomonadota bacterium]
MSAADIPANEAQRLAVLRSLDILDSEENSEFKNLVKLVEQVFNVPMVAVSFVDEKRQWFKSSVGLPVCETSREVSFCAHVIACAEPLIVEDAMLDERFFDNPMVTGEPYLKFYAGMPLAPFDGVILGTLCIMSDKPREFSDEDYNLLAQFAKQVETLISHHVDQTQLLENNEKL